MRVTVALEQRFELDAAGRVIMHPTFRAEFWERYRTVFDEVVILARAERTSRTPRARSIPSGISLHAVPNYKGPADLLRNYQAVSSSLKAAISQSEAIILRVPGTISNLILHARNSRKRPIGLEVVGDPWEVFKSGSVGTPLRPLLRLWFDSHLKRQCRRAACVSYVTKEALQKRYPPGASSFATSYASVSLLDEDFSDVPHRSVEGSGDPVMVTIGSLEVSYKGVDTVLQALRICCDRGVGIVLKVVGEGALRPQLENLAEEIGVSDRVQFLGWIGSREEIRMVLDGAKVFVLGSRTEGLPRALLEAMARGLPCIGTAVGGIPELLPPEDMVHPARPEEMALKIMEFVQNPIRRDRAAKRNLQTASGYREEILSVRRTEFFSELKNRTAAWMRSSST